MNLLCGKKQKLNLSVGQQNLSGPVFDHPCSFDLVLFYKFGRIFYARLLPFKFRTSILNEFDKKFRRVRTSINIQQSIVVQPTCQRRIFSLQS